MIEAIFQNNAYAASKTMLDVTTVRHNALASNIANVETPGYKRVDLPQDFATQLASKIRSGDASNISIPNAAIDGSAIAQGSDGNNVQLDKELLQLGNNSLQYDTLVEFVSGSLQQLRAAITGRNV